MKKLSLETRIPKHKIDPAEVKFFDEQGAVGIFEILLNDALKSLYPQGVPMQKGKTLARLQRRLDAAEKHAESINLEDAEFDLVKRTFLHDDVKFSPQQYRVVLSIVENIEKASLEEPTEDEKKAAAAPDLFEI